MKKYRYINNDCIYKVKGRKVYIKTIDKWIDDRYLPIYERDKPEKLKSFGFEPVEE